MHRRQFLSYGALFATLSPLSFALQADEDKITPISYSPAQWRERLTPAQFRVLREEDTEPAFSSALNDEKRSGKFHCAGCDLELFDSRHKFDSGTGWPSFYTANTDHIETKIDKGFFSTRTEYHCARCGGHQGHVFDDGPKPTGLRFCNNGLALKFVAA